MRTKLMGIAILAAAGCANGGGDGPGPVGDGDMIDDLEDGDDAINDANGRQGGWYTFHDTTAGGMQEPPESGFTPTAGGADGSAYAAGTKGSGFTEWGAGMGFDLNNPEAVGMTGPRGKYDASPYTSLAFKAKGNVQVRIALETVGISPTDAGGTCTPSTVEGMECEDHHGAKITLTGEWKDYEIKFAQVKQEGWGKPVPFDPTTVTAILFQVDKDIAFDFAVDDVRFYQ